VLSRVSKIVPFVLVVALLAISALPALAAPPSQEEQDIVDTAIANGNFTTLVSAVEAAGLVDTLKGEGPFTVFAPTDEAFNALPEGTVPALLADIPALTDVLLYHVVPGEYMAADVAQVTSLDTELGEPLSVRVEGDAVYVNDAMIVTTDVQASNGVIHVIDAVLMPPAEDEMAAGEETMAAEEEMAGPDIVDTAIANGNFTTLVSAVEAAGLVDTLKDQGPYTVFAPTDEAFNALPEGTLPALLADIPALTDVLLYHVVPGKYMAADLTQVDSLDTALGVPLAIRVENGNVFVNDVQVTTTDIETSNGVIHVINGVLIPPAEEEPATLPETGADYTSNALLILFAIGAGLVLVGVAFRVLRPAGLSGDTK
jgi:transforming growth factor-beta-induced protein